MSCMERLVMLNLLPLVLDRELKDLVFYFKFLFGSSDINQSVKQFVYKTMFTSLVNTYEVERSCMWTLVVTCPCYRSMWLPKKTWYTGQYLHFKSTNRQIC